MKLSTYLLLEKVVVRDGIESKMHRTMRPHIRHISQGFNSRYVNSKARRRCETAGNPDIGCEFHWTLMRLFLASILPKWTSELPVSRLGGIDQ